MQTYQRIGNQRYTASKIAPMCGALCLRASDRLVTEVQLDSRQCKNGSLFFALKGEQSDGFQYIEQAEKQGACAVVVDYRRAREALLRVRCAVLAVTDVKQSLQVLAKNYVQLFDKVQSVGITGSCGKSTTKEALARILSALGPTAKTEGNLNSEYGLPLSLFSLDEHTRYSVFELGIDHVGEMDVMLKMIKTDVALLTNIGISHLQKLGSRKTIAEEKAKIFHPTVQAGFISRACTYGSMIRKRAPVYLQSYAADDITAEDLGLRGWRISYKDQHFEVRAVGRHLLEDIVGAITVGEHFGVPAVDIAHALDGFTPMKGRCFVDAGDITIIDDSYNASLDSMQGILSHISSLSYKGQKKVVLGPMKELGSMSVKAHRQVARVLARSSFSTAYLYGKEMEVAKQELMNLGFLGDIFYTDDFAELALVLNRSVARGDLFLLKASRSMAFERLIPSLKMQVQEGGVRYA